MRLGKLDVQLVDDGTFWFDGGVIFGIVPRTVWSRLAQPDERNRIRLGLNSLLIRSGNRTALVETGIGRNMTPRQKDIYGIDDSTDLLRALAAHGVRPEDVHVVINTHLHCDHAGWNTRRDERGRLVPTFPRARYVVQRGEWQAATHPTDLTTVSYRPEHFVPLADCGVLELIDGEAEVAPGVHVLPAPGHTPHHQAVLLKSEGQTACFTGDLIPTSMHLRKAYFCAFDASPGQVLEAKRELLGKALRENWILFYPHDANVPASRLRPPSGDRQFALAEPLKI